MRQRWQLLDFIRGCTVISMVAYHAAYDAVLFGASLPWLFGGIGTLWQLSIGCSFFLLSGFCHGFSRHPLRHASTLLLCGLLATLVTTLFLPSEQIRCGVLTCLGLCGLVATALRSLPYRPKYPFLAAVVCLALFLIFYHLPDGYLGFGKLSISVPSALYQSSCGYVLGLPSPWFYSADYFPLIPWVFLYLCGYFLCGTKPKFAKIRFHSAAAKLILFLGRHSLWVYLVHQPILMAVFYLVT